MRSSTSFPEPDERPAARLAGPVLAGFLAGPIAWLASLEAGYVAASAACDTADTLHLHLAVLMPLVLVAAGAATVLTATRRVAPAATTGLGIMPGAALWFCGAFAVLILATYLPVLSLERCR